MKKATSILFLGIAVAVMASVSGLSWSTTSIHLGRVEAGESVDLAFEFTNHSNEAVKILSAQGSCGCTNVAYSKEEVLPGESAEITATFKSSKVGMFKKNIRIRTSDSEELTYLFFNGEVVN